MEQLRTMIRKELWKDTDTEETLFIFVDEIESEGVLAAFCRREGHVSASVDYIKNKTKPVPDQEAENAKFWLSQQFNSRPGNTHEIVVVEAFPEAVISKS